MAKQTKKQQIAVLFNIIIVSRDMQAAGGENRKLWQRNEAQACVELADKHGIVLPGIEQERNLLRMLSQ